MVKGFWVDGWEHVIFSAEELRVGEKCPVIRQLCFGPLETVEYGVLENGEFYCENRILEGIGEGDSYFEIIDKESFLKAVENELRLCGEYAPQLLEQAAKQIEVICEKLNIGKLPLSNLPS